MQIYRYQTIENVYSYLTKLKRNLTVITFRQIHQITRRFCKKGGTSRHETFSRKEIGFLQLCNWNNSYANISCVVGKEQV